MRFKILIISISLLLTFLTGCNDKETTGQSNNEINNVVASPPPTKKSSRTTKASVIKTPLLRERLPSNVLSYIRIPNMWGYLTAPNQASLNKALADKVNSEAVEQLIKATRQVFLPLTDDGAAILHFLFADMNAPIEIAAIPNDKAPLPDILLHTSMNISSYEKANELLTQVIENTKNASLEQTFSATDPAILHFGAISLFLDFNNKNGELNGLLVPRKKDQKMDVRTYFKEMKGAPLLKMQALEDEIDQDGQGAFVWLDIRALINKYSGNVPADKLLAIQMSGLIEAKQLGFGFGTAEKKGRIKLILDIPNTGMRQLLPTFENVFDLKSAGNPSTLIALSLPDRNYMTSMESTALSKQTKADRKSYFELKQSFKEIAGIDLLDLFDILGPEVFYFKDQISDFTALHLRDKSRFYKVLKHLKGKYAKEYNFQYDVKQSFGVDIHYLKVDSFNTMIAKSAMAEKPYNYDNLWFGRFLTGTKINLYWVESGDNLILSTIPQDLVDYTQYTKKVVIKDWLNEQQRQVGKNSMLLLSSNIKDAPTTSYYIYLKMLLALSDFTGAELDLFDFPTAKMLDLPESGSVGIQIDSSDSRLSMSLNYEQYLFEGLYGGGSAVGAVAVVGILAAIALPAYKDYIDRSKKMTH